jgi:uncharacterized protein involved in exopolysaccharide biosynthesis
LETPSGLTETSGGSLPPDADNSVPESSRRFRFPLPIDPIRLLAGVLSRWPWIAIGMIIFGTAGIIAGIQMTSPTYAISVSLIKRRVPQTVQTSETGQAFRPVDLNDATLLATLLASEPLDYALRRVQNGLSSGMLRSSIEASQLEGTDIFYITYHSPISPEDAIAFSSIWAEEVNSYTQRLQQVEAREVRTILQKEVTELENQFALTNEEILNFSKEKDYLGGESQVAAVLGKLSQIELELEAARISSNTKREQLKSLTEQIRHQSPIELQLKTAKEELANLRATYTDANPLVQTKLQSIEYLEGQITKLGEQGEADLDAYTGTPLGNQIYLTIISLRNELMEADKRIESLEKLQETTAARLTEFPGIINGYQALQKRRDSIIEGLSLMSNRLKEAEIFASGAPGYWQVFQAPDPRSIAPSSVIKKPAILGAAGGIAGAGLAVFLSLLFTHRSSRRSILECCAATRAPLITHLPITFEEDAKKAVEHFWITHLAPHLSGQAQVLFWTPAIDPKEERRLWLMLAQTVFADTGRALGVFDLTPDSLWSDNEDSNTSLIWKATPQDCTNHDTSWVIRAAALPNSPARVPMAAVNHWIAVVTGTKESLSRAVAARALTDVYLPPCSGTIAWIERPDGPIRQAADLLSCFLARRFSS